jgi:beta-xylosidase
MTNSDLQMSGNPVLPGWYADPELHLFGDRYYIYPTCSEVYESQTFFEVWASDDLTNWKNEGKILDFADVPWSTNRAAWAPSVTEKDGTYYIYFSAGDGAGIGVATSASPVGPFVDALGHPLIKDYHHGAQPIDAHAFTDDDGTSYLYYGGWSHAVVVRLGSDMTSVVGPFLEITPENYVEGSFMLKREGMYYYMWSEGGWTNSTYGVAYAISDNPLGPFVRQSKILETDPLVGKGAGHHSVLNLPGTDEFYICYHRRPLEEEHANHRVTCIERMYFDGAGNIEPIKLTREGVEARPARSYLS